MRSFSKWLTVAAIGACLVLTDFASHRQGRADETIAPITYEQPIPSRQGFPAEPAKSLKSPPGATTGKPSEALPLRRSGNEESSETASARPSLISMFGSLAMVVALFLILMWLMRRWTPGAASALPGEIVHSLGRTAIAPRCHVHLVRCGSKLLLVSLSQTGAQTLTEITERDEVERITATCRNRPGRAPLSTRWWAPARHDELGDVDLLSRTTAKRSQASSAAESRHA